MKTAAQIANDAKVRLQKDLIARLRRNGPIQIRDTWYHMLHDATLAAEIASYDLGTPQRQCALNKVAFPDYNRDEVNAALEAGATLNDLYRLALGKARIAKDSAGRYLKGKRGLRIVPNIA